MAAAKPPVPYGVPCMGCKQKWECPRTVRYVTPKAPKRIRDCGNLETIVVQQTFRGKTPTLPTSLFQNIKLTDDSNFFLPNSLVSHFEYDKDDGEVFYSIGTQKKKATDLEYGLLITLNSWYMTLFTCLMSVSSTVADLFANVMLCAALFSDSKLAEQFNDTRFVFAGTWLAVLLISLAVAWRSALWEWYYKASPRVGDLITNCNRFDRWYAFIALVAFTFFDVQRQVRDIVTMLHPWKSVQPYAAIKCEGHRAYIIGYLDEFMFRTENRTGQQMQLLWYILTKTAIFSLKLWMVCHYLSTPGGLQSSFTLLASLLSSVVCVVWAWIDYYHLRKDRNKIRRKLLESVQAAQAGSVDRRQDAARGLLALHFAQQLPGEWRPPTAPVRKPSFAVAKTRQMGLQQYRRYLEEDFSKHQMCGHCGRSLRGQKQALVLDGTNQLVPGDEAHPAMTETSSVPTSSQQESPPLPPPSSTTQLPSQPVAVARDGPQADGEEHDLEQNSGDEEDFTNDFEMWQVTYGNTVKGTQTALVPASAVPNRQSESVLEYV